MQSTASTANAPLRTEVKQLTDFLDWSRAELDQLYASLQVGPRPQGPSRGLPLFFAGSALTRPLAAIAKPIWQGKVFHGDESFLLNRVFGFETIKAALSEGQSWFDGKPALLIDYRKTSIAVPFIRDELRHVGGPLYLGRAYTRTPGGHAFLLDFALNFT